MLSTLSRGRLSEALSTLKTQKFERAVFNIFGLGWTGVLENTTFIWSKMGKHEKCIYYFLNAFSQIKTQT